MGGMIGREYKCRLQYTHTHRARTYKSSAERVTAAAAQWCYAILFFCSNDPIRSLIIIISLSRLSLSIYRADESPTANNRYSIDWREPPNEWAKSNTHPAASPCAHTYMSDMEKIEWWLRSKWEHKRTMQSRAHHPSSVWRRTQCCCCCCLSLPTPTPPAEIGSRIHQSEINREFCSPGCGILTL